MKNESPSNSDSRRQFVKKSLAASVVASQPTILAGLLRAEGGGVAGTITEWNPATQETTASPTTMSEDTTNVSTETTTVGSTEQTTTATTSVAYEYALKCAADPSAQSGSAWQGTDHYASGWNFGVVGHSSGLNPSGPGSDCSLTCVVMGTGARKDDINSSFTIRSRTLTRWRNPGWNLGGAVIGDEERSALASSSLQIFLSSPYTSVVSVNPSVQVTSTDNDPHNPDVKAHSLTIPAITAAGIASYEDSGGATTISQPIPKVGTTIQWAGKKTNFMVGPLILSWVFVLVRRRRGSSDPWEVDPVQPPQLTHAYTPPVGP